MKALLNELETTAFFVLHYIGDLLDKYVPTYFTLPVYSLLYVYIAAFMWSLVLFPMVAGQPKERNTNYKDMYTTQEFANADKAWDKQHGSDKTLAAWAKHLAERRAHHNLN